MYFMKKITELTWNLTFTIPKWQYTLMPNKNFLSRQRVQFYTVKYCKNEVFFMYFVNKLLHLLEIWYQ